jgi:hypothetical protein
MRGKPPRIFSQHQHQRQRQKTLTLTLRREAAHVVKLTFLPENEGLGPEFIYGRRSLPSKYEFDFKAFDFIIWLRSDCRVS